LLAAPYFILDNNKPDTLQQKAAIRAFANLALPSRITAFMRTSLFIAAPYPVKNENKSLP
jgi:hypothetical protein